MNEPRINIPELTVSELSAALKRTVEDAYGQVRVRGEISGYRGPHSSGHAYFALKDEGARIDAVVWGRTFARMRIKPEDGLEVVATGRLTTYPGRSTYQIIIDTLEPAGIGALMALLEQRKKKFAAEGLFDEARKQLLPFLPAVIGVVTSPTGAVIRDILHRLSDRFPRHVLVWPVRVQGDGAADEIAAAIRGFNMFGDGIDLPRPALIIAARGGGSIEDLWAFNEEIVVRAAAESLIPLISAVGHETDITLIDFVADRRAPTPTAAAEMAVPVRFELIERVGGLARRSLACWARAHDHRRTELRAAARALPSAEELLAVPRQRVDAAAERLPRALITNAQAHHAAYSRVAARLNPHTLRTPILRNRERVVGLAGRVGQCIRVQGERRRDRFAALAARLSAGLRANAEAQQVRIARGRERLDALGVRAARAATILIDRHYAGLDRASQLLAALSYQGVLARGFALVRAAESGRPLRSAAAVGAGTRLDIEFADGRVGATSEGARMRPPDPPRRRRRSFDPGQGSLF
ncbi:MAG: exodeoxyribonuclease VII large subunit [Xanthobacteraceae bacterium]|nr:exodeoxyribonuclease VII large subunit [Xanthobacteraceae bacterium]